MSQSLSNPMEPGDGTPVEPGGGGSGGVVPGGDGPAAARIAMARDASIDWRARALEAEAGLALALQEIEALKKHVQEQAQGGALAGAGEAGGASGGMGVSASMAIASGVSPRALLDDALEVARASGTRTSVLRYLRLRRGV